MAQQDIQISVPIIGVGSSPVAYADQILDEGTNMTLDEVAKKSVAYGPYASVAAAHTALSADGLNTVGTTVGISGSNNTVVEYWYQGGTAQANLVEKSSGGGGSEQIQSDWNQTDSTKKDFIKNKPNIPDTSNYYTKSQSDEKYQPAGDYATKTELNGKVDNVPGKGLSTNDYSNEDKAKVTGLDTALALKANASDLQELDTQLNDRLNEQDDKIELLDGHEVIVVADHTDTTEVPNPDTQKIYREYGTNSYTDWMCTDNTTTPATWQAIATYDYPGVDDEPTADSNKLVKSGGVELQTRKSDLFIDKKNLSLFANKKIEITQDDIEQGGLVYSKKVDNAKRLRCKFAIPVTSGTRVDYDTHGKEIVLNYANTINADSWRTAADSIGKGSQTISLDGFLFIIIRNADESDISVSDYNCEISITNAGMTELSEQLDSMKESVEIIESQITSGIISKKFKIGAYNAVTPVENPKRAYFPLTPITDRIFVGGVDTAKYRIQVVLSNNGEYVQNAAYTQETDDNADTVCFILPAQYASNTNMKFGVTLVNKTDADISEAELENINNSVRVSYKVPNLSGRHIMRYRFGGAGNDWCFVRTPDNYKADGYKKCPVVICNHGNGWEMGNTPYTMSWTNITMYAPSSYIASQAASIRDRFIETSDFSLWWSNPTIEALLAAGFVVCGCENYGDGLYGNENCRKACEAFYEHIVANFNVEERCCMIGASNGAQTSIVAAYIMGAKVKAMVLQYPLTCLVNQYFDNTSQQAGIRTAYGITNTGIDENGLISATRTHDVLHTDIVDGKKIGYFPPCKLYYSLGDTVVDANKNALPLFDCLDASLKVVEKKACTGDHGDASHFAPSEFVAFLSTF